jgi:PBP1b-binding outer membrane lipoprotein LpoB
MSIPDGYPSRSEVPARGLPGSAVSIQFTLILEILMKITKYLSTLVLTYAVLLASGCASTATQSSAGEAIDDTVITARVKTAIFNDPELSAAEINVETFKGTVQLSGFVSDSSDIAKAAEVTRAISGVKSVKNDIAIK